jgi:DNA polymerase III epsilon subunit-like protein
MRSSTSFCRIPGGPRGYKWPKLQELHQALFSVEFDAAHDAVADVRACAKCFFELKRRGVISGAEAPEEDDEVSLDDQVLFDEIYSLADLCPWFDTDRFVDNVYAQFEDRGFITLRRTTRCSDRNP